MAATPYDNRKLVACNVIPGSELKFGWRSPDGVTEATRNMLGHVDAVQADGSYILGYFLGGNFPQPPRVKKRGVGSYYCAIDRTSQARADGWKISKPAKYMRGGPRGKSIVVAIDLRVNDEEGNPVGPAMKIARFMRNTTKARITDADLAALGVEITTANDNNLIYGAEYPRPPEARFVAVNIASNIDTYGTMVDPKKLDALPTGWSVTSQGNY